MPVTSLVARTLTYLTGMTAAEWAADNRVLKAYEVSINSDDGLQKIGNNSGAWSTLGYFGGGRTGVPLTTTPVATVSIAEFGDGRDMTTVLTLTNFIVGALASAAASLGFGNIVLTMPAGNHTEIAYYQSLSLTCPGTAVAAVVGLGSVVASGAIAVLSGTATFQDRLTGQTINTAAGGGAVAEALKTATAGVLTGIALNVTGSVKNIFLNAAGAWNANNTSNLLANGTIVIKWTKMGA